MLRAVLSSLLLLGVEACTAVTPANLQAHRAAGATRSYERPASDVYDASLIALDRLGSSDEWKELRITEQDRRRRVIVAERRLDSRILPGVGVRDAIGVFIDAGPRQTSDVTVVSMSSDQIPGGIGTQAASLRTAHAVVFPEIDAALRTIPETPAALSAATSFDSSATTMDRVYAVLSAREEWRPLTREKDAIGAEEIRIGGWARVTASERGVVLSVRQGQGESQGSAADVSRLRRLLEGAGIDVDVVQEAARSL